MLRQTQTMEYVSLASIAKLKEFSIKVSKFFITIILVNSFGVF